MKIAYDINFILPSNYANHDRLEYVINTDIYIYCMDNIYTLDQFIEVFHDF